MALQAEHGSHAGACLWRDLGVACMGAPPLEHAPNRQCGPGALHSYETSLLVRSSGRCCGPLALMHACNPGHCMLLPALKGTCTLLVAHKAGLLVGLLARRRPRCRSCVQEAEAPP